MKRSTKQALCIGLAVLLVLLLPACKSIQEIKQAPLPYFGNNQFASSAIPYSASKKNIFIVADKNGTEIFDMLTPFYLFNETGKANVYIVARERKPVVVKKNLFILPQLTFQEADSMQLEADAIIIPALSVRTEQQDIVLLDWIKGNFREKTKMLAICDGATTAAATGLYDGKPMTCHASDYAGIRPHFPKVNWVQHVNVTKSGNLYSTAGVSNAVEGSLTVIDDLFGRDAMLAAAASIYYPHTTIKTVHNSVALSGKTKCRIASKIIFRKNKNSALLLQNGMNEFLLAAITDTYARSFPRRFSSFCLGDSSIVTQYGLRVVAQPYPEKEKLDEVHVTMPLSPANTLRFSNSHTEIIQYQECKSFVVEKCLARIASLYGANFSEAVKILLDYN